MNSTSPLIESEPIIEETSLPVSPKEKVIVEPTTQQLGDQLGASSDSDLAGIAAAIHAT